MILETERRFHQSHNVGSEVRIVRSTRRLKRQDVLPEIRQALFYTLSEISVGTRHRMHPFVGLTFRQRILPAPSTNSGHLLTQ